MQFHLKMVRRIARRRAAGETVKTTKFYNRLTKAWLSGAEIELETLAQGLTDHEAFEREIAEIGSSVGLWNEAPGGQGFSSTQWSDAKFREKMEGRSAAMRTPEYRGRRSKIAQSMWDDPATREKLVRAIWNDDRRKAAKALRDAKRALKDSGIEQRRLARQVLVAERTAAIIKSPKSGTKTTFTSEGVRVVQLAAWRDPEKRAKRLALFASQEYRAKVSKGVRSAYERDPTLKERVASMKGKSQSQASKNAISEKAKDRWATSKFREKMTAVEVNPDTVLHRSEAARRGWCKRNLRAIGG